MIFIRGNIKIYTPERGSGLQVLILLKWNGGGKGGTADTLKWNGGGEGGDCRHPEMEWRRGRVGDSRHPEIVLSSY